MKNNELIEIKNLTYKNIFHELNLVLPKDKFISISGTNMSGKTTLIKLLSGLIKTEDSVFYKNIKIEEINKSHYFNEIGIIIPVEKQLFINDTVENELFSILGNIRIEQDEKILQYQKIIKLLDIEGILSQNPNELGKYNRVKLLLASALLSSPRTLFLDNICSDISKNETKDIINILEKINKDEKITIIMSTNNLNEVLTTDYLYILKNGKIEIEGNPIDVLKQDNRLNKIGLEIPFMVDLSVKLNDYSLLDDIILDMDRMVDSIWK